MDSIVDHIFPLVGLSPRVTGRGEAGQVAGKLTKESDMNMHYGAKTRHVVPYVLK